MLHNGTLDHYDTIFCVVKFQFEEIRFCEKPHETPEKKLMECGYGPLEELRSQMGAELVTRELGQMAECASELLANQAEYREKTSSVLVDTTSNFGYSSRWRQITSSHR